MIQTTKDADKAKTSQRQRVDDHNDRFVSRNYHHAPHRYFGRYSSRSSAVFRICCVTHSPGPAKERVGFSTEILVMINFIPHTFDEINTALFLMAHDLGLGTRSEGTDTDLGPFGRFARRRPARPSFKL